MTDHFMMGRIMYARPCRRFRSAGSLADPPCAEAPGLAEAFSPGSRRTDGDLFGGRFLEQNVLPWEAGPSLSTNVASFHQRTYKPQAAQ